ncbi:Uncharacterized protein HZ326_2454 [Fusarium oxysporum f. sp. albedinis]|nr:Uncharacterized protein HZ326_2454 [Fusarium oxysporum f. sp. albedinis]
MWSILFMYDGSCYQALTFQLISVQHRTVQPYHDYIPRHDMISRPNTTVCVGCDTGKGDDTRMNLCRYLNDDIWIFSFKH